MTRDHLTSRDPLAPIPPSRHPFQFWVLAACLFSGWVVLLADPSTAFSRSIPYFINVIWGLLLVIASSTALLSAWWTDRITGLIMERVALGGIGLGSILYGLVVIFEYHWVGAQSGGLTVAVGIASLWRMRHVSRELIVLIRLVEARKAREAAGLGEGS